MRACVCVASTAVRTFNCCDVSSNYIFAGMAPVKKEKEKKITGMFT